jgi:hypothetical protein
LGKPNIAESENKLAVTLHSAIEALLPGSFALHIVRISLLRAVNLDMPAALRRPIFYFDSVGLVKNAEKNGEAYHPIQWDLLIALSTGDTTASSPSYNPFSSNYSSSTKE